MGCARWYLLRYCATSCSATVRYVLLALKVCGHREREKYFLLPRHDIIMETLDAIKTRKSVRRFQDRPVEREKMNALLEAAVQAPSWTNNQCWRFIVVTEKETIEKLTKANSNFNSWLKDAPVVIVACADPKDSGDWNGLQYFMMDVSLAMHNLVLMATDMGLGTCYLGAYDEMKVKEILGVPDNIRVAAMSPLGYPLDKKTLRDKMKGAILRSSNREPIEKVSHWEKW